MVGLLGTLAVVLWCGGSLWLGAGTAMFLASEEIWHKPWKPFSSSDSRTLMLLGLSLLIPAIPLTLIAIILSVVGATL